MLRTEDDMSSEMSDERKKVEAMRRHKRSPRRSGQGGLKKADSRKSDSTTKRSNSGKKSLKGKHSSA